MKDSDRLRNTARVWLGDTLASIGFLTRIPVHDLLPDPHPSLSNSMRGFPIVGLVIGAIGAVVFALSNFFILPPLVIASLTLASMLVATGALHADGLADTADGFGGGGTVDRKLAIMRDSHIGSYGVVALVLVLLIEAASLAAIANHLWYVGPAVIVAAAVLSRAAMVWLLYTLPPARGDGLSAQAGRPAPNTAMSALVLGWIIAALLLLIADSFTTVLFVTAACALGALAVRVLAQRQIGGQTGDVCGAIQMVCEAAVLAAAAATLS